MKKKLFTSFFLVVLSIGAWADRRWKANNPLTQGYRDYVAEARKTIDIRFVKVKAHAGNKYNELADRLAKKALSE